MSPAAPRSPEDFRERADACERLVATVATATARESLLFVAARWRSLANEDEAKTRKPTGRPMSPTPSE